MVGVRFVEVGGKLQAGCICLRLTQLHDGRRTSFAHAPLAADAATVVAGGAGRDGIWLAVRASFTRQSALSVNLMAFFSAASAGWVLCRCCKASLMAAARIPVGMAMNPILMIAVSPPRIFPSTVCG